MATVPATSKTGREGRGQATTKSVPAWRPAWCDAGATAGEGRLLAAGPTWGGARRAENPGQSEGGARPSVEAGLWACPGAWLRGRGEPQGCAPWGGAAGAIAPLPAGGGFVRRAGPRLVPRPSPSAQFCSPVPARSPAPSPRRRARGTWGGVPGMRRRRRAETMPAEAEETRRPERGATRGMAQPVGPEGGEGPPTPGRLRARRTR